MSEDVTIHIEPAAEPVPETLAEPSVSVPILVQNIAPEPSAETGEVARLEAELAELRAQCQQLQTTLTSLQPPVPAQEPAIVEPTEIPILVSETGTETTETAEEAAPVEPHRKPKNLFF